MIWSIAWSHAATRDLRYIPWRLAARVDAAVMALAEGRAGEGRIERMTATDPRRLRLRLPGVSALLWIDSESSTLHVARVLRGG